MPNFDAGSYFLTVLAPIRIGAIPADDKTRKSGWDDKFQGALARMQAKGDAASPIAEAAPDSWIWRLRTVLATLPTALQSPATVGLGVQSPFARNTRNHLCRLVVIEDVIYNGRDPSDPILGKFEPLRKLFGGGDPLVPQPVDALARSYLLFAADIDAVVEDGETLPAQLDRRRQNEVRDSYLRTLWRSAELEMRSVFENCEGFDGVSDADGFVAYMKTCQVETTMPFHDYWTTTEEKEEEEPEPDQEQERSSWVTYLPIIAAVAVIIAVFAWLGIVGGLLVILALAAGAYLWLMWKGQKPLPPPEHGDLPSVLKSLYLQQAFVDFVSANQGADPKRLHAAFGRFIAEHKPSDTTGPTQRPGYIDARRPGALKPQRGHQR